MKQLRLWTARIFSAVLLLALGSAWQPVVAQDDGPAEGYYFISSAAHPSDALLYNNTGTDQALRVHYANHVIPTKLTKDDKPFIFEIKKFGDGYTVRNYEANMYIGRISGMDYGEGAGFVEEPTEIQLPPSAAVDGSYLIANVKAGLTHGPLLGHQGVFQGEQITGYWGELASPNNSHSWYFDKIDPALLDDIEDITEVEGSLDDGYYFINFSNYSDPSTCMVPVQDGDLWRLGAYPRENSEFDNSFIWHVTKNADGKTYSFKNCGAQNLTYIENITKGPKESPYVVMTGTNPASFKLQFLSNGCAYIYSTDNDYNYAINGESGNIQTSSSSNAASMVKFIKVPDASVTNQLKLNEAITTAKGRQFTVGTNPGQVSQENYDAFNSVLTEAEAAASNEGDNTELIDKLNNATATLVGQIIQVEEGYYTFKNCYPGSEDYLKPYFKNNEWYLGHDAVDPTMDASAVWHVIKNADGNLVMKNCGTQDSTYIVSAYHEYNWGLARMAGTSKTYQIFKNNYNNRFRLYASDCGNFWNADGGNVVSSNNDWHPNDGEWYVEKLAVEDIPFLTTLNEAITDAAGVVKDSKVGPNPGDNNGDVTEINNAIEEARLMYDEASASDDEANAMIAKLAEAVKNFNEQDHSMRQIEDGYYYIVSTQDGFQEKGKIAMYLPNTGYMSWKVLRKNNGQYLFNIKNLGDGTFSIQNVEYALYVGSNTANGIGTTGEQTVGQKFEFNNGIWLMSNTVDNGNYTLKTYKSETSGVININDGSNIKDWTLVRESNQAVIDSILNASEQVRINQAYTNALQKAEPAYKAVFRYNSDHNDGLIKETNEAEPLKGQVWGTQVNDSYTSYAHLIDGDLNTCFQSSWDESTWDKVVEEGQGKQWLQVDLRSNPVDNFEFYFGLRNNDWGWKECWSNIDIYATNNTDVASLESFDEADWTHVGNYTDLTSYIKPEGADMNSTGRYIYYPVRGLDQQYRYIRFVVRSTIVPQSCMMYTIGEFQVYKSELDEANSPYNYVEGMKALVDELKPLIDGAKEKIANNTATQEDVDKMIELTQKIDALTPKTEPLDNKINEVKEYVAKFSDEGLWGDVESDELDAINNAVEEAESYDHEQPQQADLEKNLNALETAFALYKSQQKKPEANVWYYITNRDNSRSGSADEGGTGDIWSRWCYGNVIMAPHANATRSAYWDDVKNAVTWSGYDHASGILSDTVPVDPYSMWRLVKIEGNENADVYGLQNRATGTYLGTSGNRNGFVGMENAPAPYKLVLLKSGQFNIICQDEANSWGIPIHADGRKVLVTWDGTTDSPSAWDFVAVDESEIENAEITIRNNSATVITLPYAYNNGDVVNLNTDNEIATYGIKGVSEDGKQVFLYNKTSFEAGEPMVVVAGDVTKYNNGNESTRMFLPFANEFTTEVKEANGIVGTLDYTVLPANAGIVKADSIISIGDSEDSAIFGQRGYINASKIVNNEELSTDFVLYVDGDIVNGINNAVVSTSNRVNVYTTDGVLVKKNVKAANAKDGLKKGVYIIGKDKVLVK